MMLFRRSRKKRGGDGGPAMEDGKSCSGSSGNGGVGHKDKCRYKSQRVQLEQEIQNLQKQLQEELNLHIILAKASGNTSQKILGSSISIPDKAQELLSSITALEMTISKLEDELVSLHFQLSQERNECKHFDQLAQPPLYELCPLSFHYSWDEKASSLGPPDHQLPPLLQPEIVDLSHSPSSSSRRSEDVNEERSDGKMVDEVEDASIESLNEEETSLAPQLDLVSDFSHNFLAKDLYLHPNNLSEEMVRCMRNIYLCLSDSSTLPSKCYLLGFVSCQSSPVGHLPCSALTSTKVMPSFSPSLTSELCNYFENKVSEIGCGPYGAYGNVHQANIGSYSSTVEVSWMTVGKKQLEYAAEALRQFRFLVEQLAKVDPTQMSCNQRLAFWINLYNALIMHAYLAYGVPGSDMKLFSLMQKASYTVGGQSFNAAEIEYVLLRMKPLAHRPQMARIMSHHKFKISEEHQKYSIEAPEPLAVFALSCGMYSSPVVRVFTSDNIHEELQNSLRDYVRASIALNDKGKLLVPNLLYCFAKDVVEDSLLVDWVCRFLTPEQVSIVRDSASQWKQRLLGARSFSIVPFDSRFRYLFLPDEESCTGCSWTPSDPNH